MNIENTKYVLDIITGDKCSIQAVIDNVYHSVPLSEGNRHYDAIIQATAYDGSIWGDEVPEPMATISADWLFAKQLADYKVAVARLDQYQVALGREEVTEMQDGFDQLLDSDGLPQFDSDGTAIYEQVEVVIVSAIDPVPATVTETQYDSDGTPTEVEVENPLITKDNEERADAQEVIDNTPQDVIDAAE